MRWEYTTVLVDTWLRLEVQAEPKQRLRTLGDDGWEAFAVTPPTPAPGEGDDPDESTYEIILMRMRPGS